MCRLHCFGGDMQSPAHICGLSATNNAFCFSYFYKTWELISQLPAQKHKWKKTVPQVVRKKMYIFTATTTNATAVNQLGLTRGDFPKWNVNFTLKTFVLRMMKQQQPKMRKILILNVRGREIFCWSLCTTVWFQINYPWVKCLLF